MNILEGLQFFELVLLILGIILFMTLLVILVILTAQKRNLKQVLPFFLLPVIMIGFPGIQKISYDNGVLKIERLSQQVEENPDDIEAREELEKTLKRFENKPTDDPQIRTSIAEGHLALGDSARALSIVQDVMIENPDYRQAQMLQNRLEEQPNRFRIQPFEDVDPPLSEPVRRNLEDEMFRIEESGDFNQENVKRLIEISVRVEDRDRILRYLEMFDPVNEREEQRKRNLMERWSR